MVDLTLSSFCDAVVSGLRDALSDLGGEESMAPAVTAGASQSLPSATSRSTGHGWRTYPAGPNASVPLDAAPGSPWDGFTFVDVARLGDTVLIAFRWREHGDDVLVRVANLGTFVARQIPADFAATIVATNLLESLGGGWHHYKALVSLGGLTFFE